MATNSPAPAPMTNKQLLSLVGQGRQAKRNVTINLGANGEPGTITYDKNFYGQGGGQITEKILTPQEIEAKRVANLTGRALQAHQTAVKQGKYDPTAFGKPTGRQTQGANDVIPWSTFPAGRDRFQNITVNPGSPTGGIDAGDPTFKPGTTQSLAERLEGKKATAPLATKSDTRRQANIVARQKQIQQGERSGMAARLANYRGPREDEGDSGQSASLVGRSRKKLSSAAAY